MTILYLFSIAGKNLDPTLSPADDVLTVPTIATTNDVNCPSSQTSVTQTKVQVKTELKSDKLVVANEKILASTEVDQVLSSKPSEATVESTPLPLDSLKTNAPELSSDNANVDHLTQPYRCIVSWINNIGDFYLFPESKNSIFENILVDCQDPAPALTKVEVGTMCICCIDTVWYRARVEKVSSDQSKAKLFFVDVGRMETKLVSGLRQLKGHQETADIVEKVGLAGVEPLVGDKWSEESTENFKELVDVDAGNFYLVTRVGRGSMVQVVDSTGLDLGDALVELELAKPSALDTGEGI